MFNLYGDKIPIADDPTWRVPMTDYKPFYECELKRADKAEDALAAAIARAEAAEKRVAELEAAEIRHHEDYDGLHQDYKEIRTKWEGTADIGAELHVLRQHIAELEAAQAAQAWRPVTDPPITPPDPTTIEFYVDDNDVWHRVDNPQPPATGEE